MMEMHKENLQVLKLHTNPQYLQACCELINSEWPRSETARMMSLKASCDNLPTSLILVNDKKHILGHCKLTPIPSIPDSCFIETVVISKTMRGRKLGTFLMNSVEDYCRNELCLKMLHLSTKGQENFYAKLGYEICAPVSIYGVRVVSNIKPLVSSNKVESSAPLIRPGPPPPPPPPMPANNSKSNSIIKSTKTYMFKYL